MEQMDVGHFVIMALFWNFCGKRQQQNGGHIWMKMHYLDKWKSWCVTWCCLGFSLFGFMFRWISPTKAEGPCAVSAGTESEHKLMLKTDQRTIKEKWDTCKTELKLTSKSKFEQNHQVIDCDAVGESFENQDCSSKVETVDLMHHIVNKAPYKISVPEDKIPEPSNAAYGINSKVPTSHHPTSVDFNYVAAIHEVLKRQADIMEMLLNIQKISTLPKRVVPLFTGDPLEYRPFMKAFNHVIASNINNDSDKLYYLEQYTRGEPQMLVKSCQQMPSSQGYAEAINLLEDFYGQPFKIAAAVMEKIVKWPYINAEDGKAFNSFSIFLVSCRNIMQDVGCVNELDSLTNLKIVISKLPYKTRERWRDYVIDILDKQRQRLAFGDFVSFVCREARIINDPVFGDITSNAEWKCKNSVVFGNANKIKSFKRSFVNGINSLQEKQDFKNNLNTNCTAFSTPCFYCKESHPFTECHSFASEPHPERLKILRKAGMCFNCLVKGHLAKNCTKKLECPVCFKEHPKALHIYKAQRNSRGKDIDCQTVNSGLVQVISGTACLNQVTLTSNGAGCNHTFPMPVYVEKDKVNEIGDTDVKRCLSDWKYKNGTCLRTVERKMDLSEL